MGEVINLQEYKKEKAEEELDYLSRLVKDMVKDLDITPTAYYPNPISYHEGELGMCIDSLIWSSDVLTDLGFIEQANEVDNIIVRLTSKDTK